MLVRPGAIVERGTALGASGTVVGLAWNADADAAFSRAADARRAAADDLLLVFPMKPRIYIAFEQRCCRYYTATPEWRTRSAGETVHDGAEEPRGRDRGRDDAATQRRPRRRDE